VRAPPSGAVVAGRAPSAGLALLVLALLAVRLTFAANVPLTEDEAYYRLWSQAPALGYFDHPPMIAWWIWLGRQAAGDDPLGVRLLPCLACALSSLVVYDLAHFLCDSARIARRATVWFNAMLLVAAGGLLAVPDAAASLFWLLCLWAAARAWRERSAPWWLAAGVAAGLAGLSKYSSLFLGPGMLLWLAASAEGRRRLASPGPWLALVAAAAIFGLNVAWNADHGWVTFAKQFGRIAPHRFEPRYLAELILGQVILVNPLIAMFVARGLADAAERRRYAGLLVAVSAPFALYLCLHSLHDRVQAHWPAPLYPALAIIAAAAAETSVGGAWRRLRAAAAPFGFGLCAAALAYLAAPLVGLPLRFDPAAPVRDWGPFASRLEALEHRAGAGWIGTTSYGLAAQLLDRPGLDDPVWQIGERERWRGLRTPEPDLAKPGLIVDLSRRMDMRRLARCFARVRPLGEIRRAAPGERGAAYAAALVSGARPGLAAGGCPD
jgi:4-amino-4-deoxy-L-arabinose transferase-like glycosyltransferase